MKHTFSDGSFVIHKIPNAVKGRTPNGWHNVSAWYTADGTLKDCEYFLPDWTSRAIPENWHRARRELETIGRIYRDRRDYTC